MTINYYSENKIAAGWNQAGSLSSIETVLGIEGMFPFDYGSYFPGIHKIRGNGLDYLAGKKSVKWPYSVFMFAKHPYLMTTYCNGGYRGKVTVRCSTTTQGSYANYNAIMILPDFSDVRVEIAHFEDYFITFFDLVAI